MFQCIRLMLVMSTLGLHIQRRTVYPHNLRARASSITADLRLPLAKDLLIFFDHLGSRGSRRIEHRMICISLVCPLRWPS